MSLPGKTRLSDSSTAASRLASRPVGEVMHRRIVTCPPETSLRIAARMMSTYRIHALIVHDDSAGDRRRRPWSVVSAQDVAGAFAAGDIDRATARDAAATEFVTIGPDEALEEAARLLHEHEVAHLVVVDPPTGRPIGVLSTLDIAAAIAGLA
jgi:CBS domain-containing protein